MKIIHLLKQKNLTCFHRLEQKKITDYLLKADKNVKRECELLFRKNRMLPRRHLTQQVDVVGWKSNHWAALAIEEKDSEGARKILDVSKDSVVLKVPTPDNVLELHKSGRQLYLQCKGEALLTQAYCNAIGVNAKAIPIGVVNYDLYVNSKTPVNWVYHRGVFFVKHNSFSWFLNEYTNDEPWIKKVVDDSPKVAYDRGIAKSFW